MLKRIRWVPGKTMRYIWKWRCIEWLRELGISAKKREEDGMGQSVVCVRKYKKPIEHDDVITVKISLKTAPLSVEFEYEILNDFFLDKFYQLQ
jgi:acyl-CoA thioesterase FadM